MTLTKVFFEPDFLAFR